MAKLYFHYSTMNAGKSTILLQTLCAIAERMPALYVTGEESQQQVAMRAQRLGLPQDKLRVMTETCIETIIATARVEQPKVMVIDSIQTIFTEQLQSAPGGVSQVRESAALLVRYAKQSGTAIFLVGHVTKEGALAGPRVLEHMVDTVLYFEGESDGRLRLLRAVKNRFGAVNELSVFAMTEKGLKGVSNPSALFLSQHDSQVPVRKLEVLPAADVKLRECQGHIGNGAMHLRYATKRVRILYMLFCSSH